jgi:hypothetical protein
MFIVFVCVEVVTNEMTIQTGKGVDNKFFVFFGVRPYCAESNEVIVKTFFVAAKNKLRVRPHIIT